jgi:hypothetical protein
LFFILGVLYDSNDRCIKWDHIVRLCQLQKREGLTLANKLGSRHIQYQRHKMNVKVASQTLSSSVADAIEFLMKCGEEGFEDAAGTVNFIRIIDRLFDMMNSKNAFAQGFKQPLRPNNSSCWTQVFGDSIAYLLTLRTDESKNGTLLVSHRRKTFVIGFVTNALSMQKLAFDLCSRAVDPFQYLLTYKLSQDHLELTFACVRGKNGFNNNPDVIQFKSAMRRLVMHNSIAPSRHANCAVMERTPDLCLFNLKWSRRRTPVQDIPAIELQQQPFLQSLLCQLNEENTNPFRKVVLYYISGSVVRDVMHEIECTLCAQSLTTTGIVSSLNDHLGYSKSLSLSHSHSFIAHKNRGGLILPSSGVVKIVETCEQAFRACVCGENSTSITAKQNINVLMLSVVLRKLSPYVDIFPMLNNHFDHDHCYEDMHVVQLIKKIAARFLTIRLKTYGQRYYREVIEGLKSGLRQQSNKNVIFLGL